MTLPTHLWFLPIYVYFDKLRFQPGRRGHAPPYIGCIYKESRNAL